MGPAGEARRAERWAAQNRIDPIESVRIDRIYLFSGTRVADPAIGIPSTFTRTDRPAQLALVREPVSSESLPAQRPTDACELVPLVRNGRRPDQ